MTEVASGTSSVSQRGNYWLPVYDEATGEIVPFLLDRVDTAGMVFVSKSSLVRRLGGDTDTAAPDLNLRFPCGLELKTIERDVLINGVEIPEPLTHFEFSILELLARAPRVIHSRDAIRNKVWAGQPGSEQSIDSHISNTRRKLGASTRATSGTSNPNRGIIYTVRERGFKMGGRVFEEEPLVYPTQLS